MIRKICLILICLSESVFFLNAQDLRKVVSYNYYKMDTADILQDITVCYFMGKQVVSFSQFDTDSVWLLTKEFKIDTLTEQVYDERNEIRLLLKKNVDESILKDVYTIKTVKIETPDFGYYSSISMYDTLNRVSHVLFYNRSFNPTGKVDLFYDKCCRCRYMKKYTYEVGKGFQFVERLENCEYEE